MKFKLRVMDAEAQHHQNQIYHSQSSSSSSPYTYFTEQPIRAGFPTGHFSGGHGGPEMFRECFDMRDAIHRELEKERIREAIIAEDMARKRILEEEVRHELMMEREMAVMRTGGGLYFPVPLPPTHNHLLEPVVLHRQPIGLDERIIMSIEEKNSRSGGEIRVLDSSVTGAKRKQAPPVTGESSGSGSHSNTSKRRISEEWSCAICQVTATSERGLTEHLQGKKHQLKEAALIAKKTGACHGLGVSTKKPVVKLSVTTVNMSSGDTKSKPKPKPKPSGNRTSSSTNETSRSTIMLNESKKENVEKKKDKFKFWCEMCKVGAFCEKVMNNHKEGKKHSVNLVKLLQKGKPELPFDVKENTQVAGEDEVKSDTEEEGDE